jgi:hypothetical protein
MDPAQDGLPFATGLVQGETSTRDCTLRDSRAVVWGNSQRASLWIWWMEELGVKLDDLANELRDLKSGRVAAIHKDVYADLFPPGEPDEPARP